MIMSAYEIGYKLGSAGIVPLILGIYLGYKFLKKREDKEEKIGD